MGEVSEAEPGEEAGHFAAALLNSWRESDMISEEGNETSNPNPPHYRAEQGSTVQYSRYH